MPYKKTDSCPIATPCPAPSHPIISCEGPCGTINIAFFLVSTLPLSLTTLPTFLNFTCQSQSAGITTATPSITFTVPGTYMLQLSAPLFLSSNYEGTSTFLISPNTSGDMMLAPTCYTSPPFSIQSSQFLILFHSIITVTTVNSTLSFRVSLSSPPHTGTVSLESGTIFCHQLA